MSRPPTVLALNHNPADAHETDPVNIRLFERTSLVSTGVIWTRFQHE
jgi:hypothetical protein